MQIQHWLNTIILKDKAQRDEFLKKYKFQWYHDTSSLTLMNKLPMFMDAQCDDLSNSEWLGDRVVNLPSSVII